MTRREQAQKTKDDLRDKLAEEYGVVGDPKLQDCFDLAWDYGHSCGLHEVAIHFDSLVVLIK